MDNQHRKITGYRELNEEEIDLMNEVKALGVQIEAVLLKVGHHITEQNLKAIAEVDGSHEYDKHETILRHNNATPSRFLSMAKSEFQTGLMHATRAVAQPEFF